MTTPRILNEALVWHELKKEFVDSESRKKILDALKSVPGTKEKQNNDKYVSFCKTCAVRQSELMVVKTADFRALSDSLTECNPCCSCGGLVCGLHDGAECEDAKKYMRSKRLVTDILTIAEKKERPLCIFVNN